MDRQTFHPRDRCAAKAALGLGGPVLLSVGNLIPSKGHLIAMAALKLLPDATLLIAGDGPLRATLDAATDALGIRDRVRMLGSVPPETLAQLYAAADALVLPTAVEGLANVWLESLACGTPVVTCDVDGANEVIDHPAAGRIVARDPTAIASAVRELLAMPPDPVAVSASVDRFDWGRNADELDRHLRVTVERFVGA